jgi:hypothetical protein
MRGLQSVNPALTRRLAPLGLLVGFAAGFFGIGGGFLIVPGLMAATGMTLADAAASSLVSVVLFGATTSASYAVSGLVDWTVFGALVAGGGVGALAGVPVARGLAGQAPGRTSRLRADGDRDGGLRGLARPRLAFKSGPPRVRAAPSEGATTDRHRPRAAFRRSAAPANT